MMKSENLPDTTFDPLLPAELESLQLQFAAYIRDPDKQSMPAAIEARRMAIYRDLFYNNIEGFIAGNFPVMRQLFNEHDWHQLVCGFYRDYRCETPLFPEIPEEFITYLDQHNPCPEKPFLAELAHYEWVELALDLDDNSQDMSLLNPNGDVILGVPVISPQAWVLNYQWPVDKIRPDNQPTQIPDQPSYILIHRSKDETIEFIRLNQVSARLCELMSNDDALTGAEIINQIASELGRNNDSVIFETGRALMLDFRQQQIILGTRTS